MVALPGGRQEQVKGLRTGCLKTGRTTHQGRGGHKSVAEGLIMFEREIPSHSKELSSACTR